MRCPRVEVCYRNSKEVPTCRRRAPPSASGVEIMKRYPLILAGTLLTLMLAAACPARADLIQNTQGTYAVGIGQLGNLRDNFGTNTGIGFIRLSDSFDP